MSFFCTQHTVSFMKNKKIGTNFFHKETVISHLQLFTSCFFFREQNENKECQKKFQVITVRCSFFENIKQRHILIEINRFDSMLIRFSWLTVNHDNYQNKNINFFQVN